MKEIELEPVLANVEQVTLKGKKVLVPLVPLGAAGTEIDAAIVYDLHRLGFRPGHPFMKNRPVVRAGNSVKRIVKYVQSRGHRVIQRRGRDPREWNRELVPVDAPIPVMKGDDEHA